MGAIIAITCAFTWSLAIVLFKKCANDIHPVLLNLCKNSLGLALMIPTVLFIEKSLTITQGDLAILVISGLLGIGLADALVLKALTLVGATRIAIIECAYSPFVIFLSLLFLGEVLTPARLFGTVLVLAAILCVTFHRDAAAGKFNLHGMVYGVSGLFAMAGGIVMIKPLFERVPLFWIICIRLAAGVAASAALFFLLRHRRPLLAALARAERKGLIIVACVLSTYISMIFWVAGYKYNDAMITAVLNQTSTIFTVLLATILLKERLTWRKTVGTVMALSGVLVISLY